MIVFVVLLCTHSYRFMSFLCRGSQSSTQYDIWGLTRAEYMGRITSYNLLVTLLLMQFRIQLTF